MKTLTNDSRVKIARKKGGWHYGTVGTLAASYAHSKASQERFNHLKVPIYMGSFEAYKAEMLTRQDCEVWAGQDVTMLVASGHEIIAARQRACVEIEHGEEVLVDGEKYRVRFKGDYSDFIAFDRA